MRIQFPKIITLAPSIRWLALFGTICAGAAVIARDSRGIPDAKSIRAVLPNPELSGDSRDVAAAQRDTIVRMRQSLDRAYEGFANFVFHEHIERFRSDATGDAGRRIDMVNALVSVDREQEQYTEIRQGKKSRRTIADLSGAWSAGGYSSMLRDAKKAVKADPMPSVQVADFNGAQATLLCFDIFDGRESSWEFVVGPTHYQLPFHGELWVSTATGELLRISRTSLLTPSSTGIKEVRWTVDFGALELNGKRFTVPAKGLYSVSYLNEHREWNLISLSDFHRYGAEMTVKFPEYLKGNQQ
jgi:hypothetical protein